MSANYVVWIFKLTSFVKNDFSDNFSRLSRSVFVLVFWYVSRINQCAFYAWLNLCFHLIFSTTTLETSLVIIFDYISQRWIQSQIRCIIFPAAPTDPPPEPCPSGLFTCRDGSCIDQSLVCDRSYDCPDGSDELECGLWPESLKLGLNATR